MADAVLITSVIDNAYLSNSGAQAGNRMKNCSDELEEYCPSSGVFQSAAATGKESILNRKRPFVGRCCHICSPLSRDTLFNASIPSQGLRNVIYINETHTRYRGWLARRLCYVLFIQERDVHRDMFPRNVIENVLNSTRVQKAIVETVTDRMPVETLAQPEPKAVNKVKRKARGILQQMVANISPAVIRLTGWVLLKLFNGFFWSIQIHKGQLEMVKKAAAEQNVPLIFLPVHKSHIDYLLLTFILFCHNIKAPHIAAGNNLNIPIFSTLIRKLGGFFIRRKLDIGADGRKDILYRSVLRVYIEELLRQRQFMEIFVEGTRSRSGKPYMAMTGLLSIVVDSLCENIVTDVMIIPVGISYDRIIEGNYNSEQLGKPKKKESLWGVAQGVFRMLRKNFGCVRVDFGQPFSVREYIDTQRNRPLPATLSLEENLLPTIITERPGLNHIEQDLTPVVISRDLFDEQYRRQLISNVAKHALFTASRCSAVMSTHIVACLLLYRHREGVHLSKLVEDFFCMKEVVLARDFDLGFSGNSEDVVMHALHLLGDCVNVRSSRRNSEFFIAPTTTIPALFELNFYSNGIFQVFLTEAILASSLCAVLRENISGPGKMDPTVSQERLVRTAADLCHLLSNEVIVGLPCQAVYQVFNDAVSKFIQYGILLVAEEDLSPSPTEETWANKYPDGLSWRSDEEDDSDYGEEQRDRYLKVSQSPDHQAFITFLQRLLGPLLEAYFSAAVYIQSFRLPVEETEYISKFHKYLLSRTEMKIAVFGESATFCLAKSAVKTLKDLGVFKAQKSGSTVLELSNIFLPLINRQKLLEYIHNFTVL
ncbi:glycerol-3-phosphate acyltransferase 1, mitochondrial isoform X1 [Amblyraja radiata]|uniref:glycerol-3-phosphate acyltransferase 1, mitochondrial isoform X1 n=1 Tax=Amblyraja radiata TaxID=386614 RepID=UPI001402DCC3|nr:glycerol-3-phosphate acyltransferase 1, mitochondrial isoform X1 [Amblyraja radiata]XP_032889869.1 glycerol-3-phosphate acyltransferase 1, mitochondrial isoform X1 [Amblyraja radiata]XP_032889870.1 glycerol-3-phosphate acyltransferase 1, mitochondrial isoform X1 [Amblyraja radiata]XP_032889871.1 glycerol-3-phosphate acyltransferase 1, mitochondrial isoform X1 [Amblyraja radiata]